jgi:hypothetical protein
MAGSRFPICVFILLAGCPVTEAELGGSPPDLTDVVDGAGDPGQDLPDPPVLAPGTVEDTGAPVEDTEPPVEDTGVPVEDPGPTGPQSNFQVQLGGVWEGICCEAGLPVVTSAACTWSEYDRTLTDEVAGAQLYCPEDEITACGCGDGGEPLHGINGWDLDASLLAPDGGPVYPDEELATCVVVSDGALVTAWTDEQCPNFRLTQ